MKNVESVMMNVQIDEAEAKNSCSDVERIMSGLGEVIDKILESLGTAFGKVIDVIDKMSTRLDIIIDKMNRLLELIQPDQSIDQWVEKFSTAIDAASLFVNAIAIGFSIGSIFTPVGGVIGAIIGGIIALLIEWVAFIVTNIDTIKTQIDTAVEWFSTNVIWPLITYIAGFWESITNTTSQGIMTVQYEFSLIDSFLQNIFSVNWAENFGLFGHVLNGFFAAVENIWKSVKGVFNAIIIFISDILAGNWETIWYNMREIVSNVWSVIVSIISAKIITIIETIQSFASEIWNTVENILDLLGLIDIPAKSSGNVGARLNLPTGKTPLLAQGAVLPANRPFLAVVGDQKHGTNAEAPLSTIQAAVAEVMARQGTGDINITFTGDLAQLGRVLKPVIERENRRVGGSLAKGVY